MKDEITLNVKLNNQLPRLNAVYKIKINPETKQEENPYDSPITKTMKRIIKKLFKRKKPLTLTLHIEKEK